MNLQPHFHPLDALLSVSSVNGYLNFKAHPEWLTNTILSDEIYVGNALENSGKTGERVLLEHTSANPNGPFHVGRARNAILGTHWFACIASTEMKCEQNTTSTTWVNKSVFSHGLWKTSPRKKSKPPLGK
jgi:arginyl-tRNA synthetase